MKWERLNIVLTSTYEKRIIAVGIAIVPTSTGVSGGIVERLL